MVCVEYLLMLLDASWIMVSKEHVARIIQRSGKSKDILFSDCNTEEGYI